MAQPFKAGYTMILKTKAREAGDRFQPSAPRTYDFIHVAGPSSAQFGGGGIANSTATLTLNDSTVSGNSTRGAGGGIFNDGDTPVITLRNSTISNNSADFAPGIYSLVRAGNATMTLTNSTISGNLSPCGFGCPGALTAILAASLIQLPEAMRY